MDLIKIISSAKKMVSDNSPTILTVIGVTGTATTAYLAAKASFKAAEELEKAKDRKFVEHGSIVPLTNQEKATVIWKLYIPAVASGVMTCTCIVTANCIGTRRAAALAAAYSISERAFAEYKGKVVEKIGAESEHDIRKEIARERVSKTLPSAEMIFLGGGDVLCHDAFSGRFFMCDKETIRRAANDIAFEIIHSDYATVQTFYDKVGLPETSTSKEMGWNVENPCELSFSAIETPDGKPCLSYDFATVPIRDPWRFC